MAANETEIASMLVRLTGDSADYEAMLKKAEEASVRAAKVVDDQAEAIKRGQQVTANTRTVQERHKKTVTELNDLFKRGAVDQDTYNRAMKEAGDALPKVDGFFKKIVSSVKDAVSGIAGFATSLPGMLAIFGAATSLKGAFSSFEAVEKSQMHLRSAIEANGREVKGAVKDYDEWTAGMTANSLATKGQIRGLLIQAETMGITGDKAKMLARDALYLAAATGKTTGETFRAALGIQTHNIQLVKHSLGLRSLKKDSDVAAKAQRMLEIGQRNMAEEANSSTGKIEKLGRSFAGLSVKVGGMVSEAIQPFLDWLTKAVDWSVEKLGGLGYVWDYVKEKAVEAWEWTKDTAQEFWDWFQPVWQAMESFAVAVWDSLVAAATWAWDTVKELASNAWDYIKEVFGSITGDSDLTWDKVRDGVRDAFIFAEWAVKNFGTILKWLWVGAEYEAVKFFNQVEYFFKDVIPALARYFYDNWELFILIPLVALPAIVLLVIKALWDMFTSIDWSGIWEGFKQAHKDAFMWVVSKATSLFTSLWDYIRHPSKVALLFADATMAAANAGAEAAKAAKERFDKDIKILTGQGKMPPLVIPERVAGELEKSLKDEFDRLGAGLGQSWQEFRENKLAEFAENGIPPEVLEKANKKGGELGKSYVTGANKEIKKLDAVAFASAASFAKIMEYQDRLSGLKDAKANTATDAKSAAGLAKQDKANLLLQDIRDNLKDAPKINIGAGGDLT